MSDPTGFDATLTHAERHLAHRLVAFGDVVFGFTISQLAFQLELPRVPEDLVANPLRYVVYAVTFSLIAFCWFTFHRMTSVFFRPTRADLVAVFAFLAWLGLVPYAMFAFVRFATRFGGRETSLTGASYGLGAYVLAWLGIIVTSQIVALRNYRRSDGFLEPEVRRVMRVRLTVSAAVGVCFATVFVVDVVAGPAAAFPSFSIFALLPIVRRVAARLDRPAGTAAAS